MGGDRRKSSNPPKPGARIETWALSSIDSLTVVLLSVSIVLRLNWVCRPTRLEETNPACGTSRRPSLLLNTWSANWKGQARPKDKSAQQFRGWPETHAWAWTFEKGKPAGLTVTIEGGKFLATGKLSYDAERKRYRLEGTEPKPAGGPIAFEGTVGSTGKQLVLDRVGPDGEVGQDAADDLAERELHPLHHDAGSPGAGRGPIQSRDRGRLGQGRGILDGRREPLRKGPNAS